MSPLHIGTIAGIKLLRAVAVVMAASLMISSSYVLWDMWHTEKSAFSSYDMLQYRPNVEQGEPATLEEVKEVNEDARAWVTMYSTHIDYPTVQGKDDLEYVNKDIHGKASPTGSIYLAAENSPDFSDPYSLLYGHHVENGPMFGDVAKYLDQGYMDSHAEGVLVTEGQVYDLEAFASIKTDAYDDMVYHPSRVQDVSALVEYAKQKASAKRSVSNIRKVLAMSTCDDYETNGRIVVFSSMTPHEGEYEPYETLPDEKTPLIGHGDRYWALLNLIALIATIYLALPLHILLAKFRRRKTMEERDEVLYEDEQKTEEDALYESARFKRTTRIGFIAEILLAVIALIVFILTEDIRLPIQIIDRWTPLMLLMLCGMWAMDVWLFRYRINREDDEEQAEEGSV